MEFVQPIRDFEMVNAIWRTLARDSARNALMWTTGIHVGFRIGDILQLRVRDVWAPGINQARTHIKIRDQKTGKTSRVAMHNRLRAEVEDYCRGRPSHQFLFRNRMRSKNQPITRARAYQIIRAACAEHGITEVGTHTMRKTFAYRHYQENRDIPELMELLNHSSQKITLRYIGVTQDRLDETVTSVTHMDDYLPPDRKC